MDHTDKKTEAFGNRVYNQFRQAACAAMAATPQDGEAAVVKAIVTGALAGAATVHQLATLVGNTANGPADPVTADETLFAAILIALTCLGTNKGRNEDENLGVCAWDISVVYDAMEMFERATGRKADPVVLKPMAEAARESAAKGNEPFAEFRAQREATKVQAERGNSSLN